MHVAFPKSQSLGAQYPVDTLPHDMDELSDTPSESPIATESTDTELDKVVDGAENTSAEVGQQATDNTNESAADPLVDEAVTYYGLTREDAELLGERLPAFLARMDEHALAGFDGTSTEDRTEHTEPTAKPAQQSQAAQQQQQHFELLKISKIEDIGLSADEHDEKVIGAFSTIKDRFNSVVDALAQRDELLREIAVELVNTKKGVESFTEATESQAEAEFTEKIDGFYASLGPEFKDVFGEVPRARLTEKSPLLAARREHVAKMTDLQKLDLAKNKPLRSIEHYATAALRLLHNDKLVSSAVRKVEQQVANRRKAGIASPSSRANKPISGREKALAGIAAHPFLTGRN